MTERLKLAQQGKHLDFLDGLHGIAVTYVLLYHFMPKTVSLTHPGLAFRLWDSFWLMGWSGVDLFFVLSGFLMTGIIFHSRGRTDFYSSFYIRRFFRIFPAYYTLILVSLLYFWPERPSVFYWLYLSNFDTELSIPFHPFLCVAWSLSIEEQYYLLYPTVVRRLSEASWLRLLIFLIISSVVIRNVGHDWFFTPRQMYHNTAAHFDGIAIGGALRLLLFRAEEFNPLLSIYRRSTPLLLIAAIALGLYCSSHVLELAKLTNDLGHVSFLPEMYRFGYFLNALLFGGIILSCIFTDGILFKIASNRLFRHLGKYSYAMYLFQFPASLLSDRIIEPQSSTVGLVVSGLIRFVFVYCVARISWILIETPSRKARDMLLARRHLTSIFCPKIV